MGHLKFLAFYLLCGVLATLAHVFSDVNSIVPSLGASGAIAGVLGGYIVLYPARQVRVLIGFFFMVAVPAFLVIGLWAALQLFNGLGSIAPGTMQGKGGVAYLAHIGGFVAGLILVKLFADGRTRAKMQQRYQYPMQNYYTRM
jgi:membrane associated rhomboid family serine protease